MLMRLMIISGWQDDETFSAKLQLQVFWKKIK